jgi:anaerobic selenocysteine-containing dehydrogenase
MLRRAGEPGFTRISWDEAMTLAADRVRASLPDRFGIFMTSRGITNEVYYVAGKVARYLGTNDVDNAARICHAPSTGALKETLGVGATTVSYTDVIDHADLVVLFGSNAANAQPVFLKYLYLAKQRGAKVAVVNPYREPALESYWVPSNVESALFGTRITDEFFPVAVGGDTAFLLGVLKVLHARGQVDRAFVDAHTTGWDELVAELERHDLDDLARWAGSSSPTSNASPTSTPPPSGPCWCGRWASPSTPSAPTTSARSSTWRWPRQRRPARGGADADPRPLGGAGRGGDGRVRDRLPGRACRSRRHRGALSEAWGFEVPATRGRSATELVEAAGRGEVGVLWSSGGNFLDTLPDPAAVRRGSSRCRCGSTSTSSRRRRCSSTARRSCCCPR